MSEINTPLRSRILQEAIAAKEKKRGATAKPTKWTKRPKYEGFQSTLDMNNGLEPLRHSNVRKRRNSTVSVASEWGQNFNGGQSVVGLDLPFTETQIGDPTISELDCGFHSSSEPFEPSSDPIMRELDEIIESSRTTPTQSPINNHSPSEMTCNATAIPTPTNPSLSHGQAAPIDIPQYDPRYPGLLLQPDSRPISPEQLATEVKSIYVGLTIVETKCISIYRVHLAARGEVIRLRDECRHWQALISLHRTLLHEHHDFYLATQHPNASPALRRLAEKYAMPTRMWNHGIKSLLKLLRHAPRIESAITFLRSTHDVIIALQENVPSMAEEWSKISDALMKYEATLLDIRWNPSDDTKYLASTLETDSDANFGDWYFQRYDAQDGVQDPLSMPAEGPLQLPQYVVDTLSGWLYFGQGIAWDSFNIYSKVFGVLSMAARRWSFLFGSF